MLAMPQPAFACWGADLRLIYNDEYRALLGAKQPGALGRPFREVFAGLAGRLRPALEAVLAGVRQRWAVDAEVFLAARGDGLVPGWFAATWTPVRDDAGRVVGFFGVATETAGRVLAEQALWTNEERMRGQKEAFQAAINGAPLEASLSILARMVTEETAGEARTAFYIAEPRADTCMHSIRAAGEHAPKSVCAPGRRLPGRSPLARLRVGGRRDRTCPGSSLLQCARGAAAEALALPAPMPFDFRGCWSGPIADPRRRDGRHTSRCTPRAARGDAAGLSDRPTR